MGVVRRGGAGVGVGGSRVALDRITHGVSAQTHPMNRFGTPGLPQVLTASGAAAARTTIRGRRPQGFAAGALPLKPGTDPEPPMLAKSLSLWTCAARPPRAIRTARNPPRVCREQVTRASGITRPDADVRNTLGAAACLGGSNLLRLSIPACPANGSQGSLPCSNAAPAFTARWHLETQPPSRPAWTV
jgi:hypothetical protein